MNRVMQNFLRHSSTLSKRRKHFSEKSHPATIHMRNVFRTMDSMRKERTFCDIILLSRNVEIPAHKVVLASSSQLFYHMFAEMGDEDRIIFDDVDPHALLSLINYIYTAEIHITYKNVQEILAGANVLSLNTVKDECSKFLIAQITPDNCLTIMDIAQTYHCKELLKSSENFIDNHFMEVVNSREFLMLSYEQVTDLISRDGLDIPSEEMVYECVMTWLKYNLKARRQYLSTLMRHVRLPLMSRDYLAKYVVNEPLLKADINCKDLIIDALLQENIPEMIRMRPRQRGGSYKTLLIMGGYSSEAEGSFELYDFHENTWSPIYTMPLKRRGASLAIVNQKIYVVGRCDITRPVNAITEYDLANDIWNSPICMTTSRTYHGVADLNDCIYAVGGRNTQGRLNTAEKFDVKTQKWCAIATMSARRSWVAVGVLNNFLYAVGGYGDYNCPLSSVERYNPQADVWKNVSHMKTPRSGAAIGVLQNKMYVMGGHDGKTCLNSVECYTPETEKWTLVAPMNICRRSASAVVINDMLYVIGGWDGNADLASIEVYNPKVDCWILLPTSMNVERSSHGAAIVEKITEKYS